jgi:hypothetical protein
MLKSMTTMRSLFAKQSGGVGSQSIFAMTPPSRELANQGLGISVLLDRVQPGAKRSPLLICMSPFSVVNRLRHHPHPTSH